MAVQPINMQPMAGHPINMQPMPGQPMPGQFMPGQPIWGNVVPGLYIPPPPPRIPGCPPGLEYLAGAEYILVKQKVEMLEVMFGCETENRYSLRTQWGHEVYFAKEDTDCCTRNCLGACRPFDMRIFDNYRQEVMHLYRPLNCQICCCPCCLQTLVVYSGQGQVLGSVEQKWSIHQELFDVKNAADDGVLRIVGPCMACYCWGQADFPIMSLDGVTQVGKISKHWSGFVQEFFTDADTFGVSFPFNMDVAIKAVLLGACFLIDYMFYENNATAQDYLNSFQNLHDIHHSTSH